MPCGKLVRRGRTTLTLTTGIANLVTALSLVHGGCQKMWCYSGCRGIKLLAGGPQHAWIPRLRCHCAPHPHGTQWLCEVTVVVYQRDRIPPPPLSANLIMLASESGASRVYPLRFQYTCGSSDHHRLLLFWCSHALVTHVRMFEKCMAGPHTKLVICRPACHAWRTIGKNRQLRCLPNCYLH